MNNIYISLLLFITFSSYAQINYGYRDFVKDVNEKVERKPKKTVIIDTKLLPYIDSYLAYAKKYLKKDLRDDLYTLDSVIIKELPFPIMGKTIMRNFKMKKVYINKWTEMDTLIMKSVVYHELTHALIRIEQHYCNECDHLISAIPPKSHIVFAKDWDKYVKELFLYCKTILKNRRKRK